MKRLQHISKITDFIPHGDDSIIDDDGIRNRWAENRRARRINENTQIRELPVLPTGVAYAAEAGELDQIIRLLETEYDDTEE